MTTIKPGIDEPARAAIAARTEALFRESGALRDGHFLLKSGRHSDAYLEKFAVLSDPAATSELCGFWAGQYRGADDRPTVDLVAGPTTGGVILAFETGRQLGTRAIFAEEVKGRRPAAARVPARLPDRARRARPARRRHPHDRRLAPRDDPGRRGRGRRDRRVRGARRPIRRPERARLADDRPPLPPQRALDPRPADVRAGPGDLPALRRGRAGLRAGEHRRRRRERGELPSRAPGSERRGASGSVSPARRVLARRPDRAASSLVGPRLACGCTPVRDAGRRPSPVDGVVDRGRRGRPDGRPGFTLRTSGGFAFTFVLGELENADRVLAEPPRRAPGVERAGPGLLPRRERRARRLPPRGRARASGGYLTASRAASARRRRRSARSAA